MKTDSHLTKFRALGNRFARDGRPSLLAGEFLPNPSQLQELLALRTGAPVNGLLKQVLLGPLRSITGSSGKRIRAQLVRAGYKLAAPVSLHSDLVQRRCDTCAEVVELVHVGSLIVDDIEDGSQVRRGQPSLHHQYGLPIALNAGNWLYFWPLELLRSLELPKESELLLYRVYHRTLLRAHFGQALDLGLRIDSVEQREVPGVCLSSMELKTGALASFALVMGAILGGASEELVSSLEEFGHGFGIALQMFDDIGNLNRKTAPSKQFEDLALRRPSWVWACAAQHYSKQDYEKFVAAVRKLPDSQALDDWLQKHDLKAKGKDEAYRHFTFTYRKLEVSLREARFTRRSFEQLRELGRKVAEAYG